MSKIRLVVIGVFFLVLGKGGVKIFRSVWFLEEVCDSII